MPYGEFNREMRAMIDIDWPRCPTCRKRMTVGSCGFLCLRCNGPTLGFAESRVVTAQVPVSALRELFPKRCLSDG